jgi:hypothetical protein
VSSPMTVLIVFLLQKSLFNGILSSWTVAMSFYVGFFVESLFANVHFIADFSILIKNFTSTD